MVKSQHISLRYFSRFLFYIYLWHIYNKNVGSDLGWSGRLGSWFNAHYSNPTPTLAYTCISNWVIDSLQTRPSLIYREQWELTDAAARVGRTRHRRLRRVDAEGNRTTPSPIHIPSQKIPTAATRLRRGVLGSARSEAVAERAAAGRTPMTSRMKAMWAKSVTARRRGRPGTSLRSKSLSTWLRRHRKRFAFSFLRVFCLYF